MCRSRSCRTRTSTVYNSSYEVQCVSVIRFIQFQKVQCLRLVRWNKPLTRVKSPHPGKRQYRPRPGRLSYNVCRDISSSCLSMKTRKYKESYFFENCSSSYIYRKEEESLLYPTIRPPWTGTILPETGTLVKRNRPVRITGVRRPSMLM